MDIYNVKLLVIILSISLTLYPYGYMMLSGSIYEATIMKRLEEVLDNETDYIERSDFGRINR